jgi:hypothetical protein
MNKGIADTCLTGKYYVICIKHFLFTFIFKKELRHERVEFVKLHVSFIQRFVIIKLNSRTCPVHVSSHFLSLSFLKLRLLPKHEIEYTIFDIGYV